MEGRDAEPQRAAGGLGLLQSTVSAVVSLPHTLASRVVSGRMTMGEGAWDEVREAEHAAVLASAREQTEDVQVIADTGCVRLPTRLVDRDGDPVVVVLGADIRPLAAPPAHLRMFAALHAEAQGLAKDGARYSVLYVHTGASLRSNSPGLAWAWWAWERLPTRYHAGLKKCFVLHPNATLRAGLAVACPADLYAKVEMVHRVEFLDDAVAVEDLRGVLPDRVWEHDRLLEEHPLLDYGIVDTEKIYAPRASLEIERED
ncbi:unnamed protein product [Pedinophyceae sp. YPF-701]|nr:unnamed protein product [Pedinophyceae sp. YPF-701]